MAIDWFTVLAQVINFLILVYLLKRFLYGPVINAMQGREQKIAARMAEADERIGAAQIKADDYDEKQRQLEDQKRTQLDQAREDAQSQRALLMDELRVEIDETRSGWLKDVEHEKQLFLREVRQTLGQQLCQVAREALTGLAEASLEQQIIRVFILRLKQLPDSERQALNKACCDNQWQITIISSFDIAASLREELGARIREQIATEAVVAFERDAGLLCGITLFTPVRKVMWSFDSYLAGIEEHISDALAATSQSISQTISQTKSQTTEMK